MEIGAAQSRALTSRSVLAIVVNFRDFSEIITVAGPRKDYRWQDQL